MVKCKEVYDVLTQLQELKSVETSPEVGYLLQEKSLVKTVSPNKYIEAYKKASVWPGIEAEIDPIGRGFDEHIQEASKLERKLGSFWHRMFSSSLVEERDRLSALNKKIEKIQEESLDAERRLAELIPYREIVRCYHNLIGCEGIYASLNQKGNEIVWIMRDRIEKIGEMDYADFEKNIDAFREEAHAEMRRKDEERREKRRKEEERQRRIREEEDDDSIFGF